MSKLRFQIMMSLEQVEAIGAPGVPHIRYRLV
jgi:hypothetical protein